MRRFLPGHPVATAYERGWANISNGNLLRVAESEFDVFVTTDQNLGYQQNLTGRQLAILVLPTTRWPEIREHAAKLVVAVEVIKPGEYRELVW